MANEDDIFAKMEALLRKHQPPTPSLPEEQPPAPSLPKEQPSPQSANRPIPVLTDIVQETTEDSTEKGEAIPVLTERIQSLDLESAVSTQELELDLDPEFDGSLAPEQEISIELPPLDEGQLSEADEITLELLPEMIPESEDEEPAWPIVLDDVGDEPLIGPDAFPNPPAHEQNAAGIPVITPPVATDSSGEARTASTRDPVSEASPENAPSFHPGMTPSQDAAASVEDQQDLTPRGLENKPQEPTSPFIIGNMAGEPSPATDLRPLEHATAEPLPLPWPAAAAPSAPETPQNPPPAKEAMAQPDTSQEASVSDSAIEQLARDLEKKLLATLEKSVVPRLSQSVDQTLSSLLDQFAMHMEYLVRETVAQELAKHLAALREAQDSHGPGDSRPDHPV